MALPSAYASASTSASISAPTSAPAIDFSKPSHPEAGQLTGPTDKRLQPREHRLYGRQVEVRQVLDFLRGDADAVVVTALVAGVGGIGKTEVCKAALKLWLAERPDALAFYVDVPDRARAAELVYRIARSLGLEGVYTPPQLLAVMRPALYYLDNLESVAEQPEGQ